MHAKYKRPHHGVMATESKSSKISTKTLKKRMTAKANFTDPRMLIHIFAYTEVSDSSAIGMMHTKYKDCITNFNPLFAYIEGSDISATGMMHTKCKRPHHG